MSDFSSWDFTFMLEAKLWATKSKDPSRKIGAVIVLNNRKTIATGYNGFPKYIEDKPEYLNDREKKYPRIIHAEMNAIHNALEYGNKVSGCSIYVYGLPTCSSCAIQLIQAGINKVIYCDINSDGSVWSEENVLSMKLFDEAYVKHYSMPKNLLDNYEKMAYSSL